MIEDQCEGIPPEDRQKYRDETQMCLKKETIPTDVSKVFNHKLASYEKHLSEERNNKICISKEKVNICNSSSSPKEVTNKKISYFCVSKEKVNICNSSSSPKEVTNKKI